MATVLVTGGYGRLGFNVVKELLDRGHNVVSHGVTETIPPYVEALPDVHRDRIIRITGDLRDFEAFHEATADMNLDAIIHSAAMMPGRSSKIRDQFEVNTGGTFTVLQTAAKRGVNRVVYVGSGSAYEGRDADSDPYTENERPAPTEDSAYSSTKYMGELLCRYHDSTLSIDVPIVRVSRLWGPPGVPVGNQNEWTWAVERLVHAGLKGEDIVQEFGSDHPQDFTFMPDAARALVTAATTSANRLTQPVYNVSGGRHVTVGEIAAICDEEFANVEFDFGPGHWYEVAQYTRPPFDISAARRDLGYEPSDFEKSLREYIERRKKQN